MPEVSVVMPVRNAAPFLAPALRSILEQTGVKFELIAVDDGSSDGSSAILADFAASHGNMHVIPGEGRGISRALNRGIAAASAPLVARMDADDIALPGRVARQCAHLAAHPDLGVLGTQAQAIDEAGRPTRRMHVPVGPGRVRRALDISSALIHPSVMMRRQLLLAAGGYRPAFDGAEDYDLWLRLADATQIDNLPDTLLLYRRHGSQASTARRFRQARLAALAYALATSDLAGAGLDTELSAAELRKRFLASSPDAARRLRRLVATRLADNGGSTSMRGGRYFRAVLARAGDGAEPSLRRRLALAAVRHELHLARAGRPAEAAASLLRDLLQWRTGLLAAYLQHGAIVWTSRRAGGRSGTAAPPCGDA
ncbi:glycosyltransferase family 2 protein [Propylenella binzhouense]|uniref:Glycosyltransferase n=1 Tax=Propylenella binzhouense TaxID=2555902 RepID=A0A964T3K8_9HYPH|nr:glycosyltransferase [Propylenella binzhouense]MYZ47745.1 glycosyltransferase [Propylenella binzhouense]